MLRTAERFFGASLQPVQQFDGGDESLVFRMEAESGSVVLHVSPSWRTRQELEWVHAVVEQVHRVVPQAVCAIDRTGETVADWEGRCVTLFPFIDGEMLDRDDADSRAAAARLLAAIHGALLDWSGGSRPSSGVARPTMSAGPSELNDAALDMWWASVRDQAIVTAPSHGDYYRRNLLCIDSQITGVIDWHDATVRPLMMELAGATFEFCRDDEHVLRLDRARDFVRAYRAADGPIPEGEIGMLHQFKRLWVRNDARCSLACDGRSENVYAKKQLQAFQDLAHIRLDVA